jgi:hypothetical protein
MLKAIRTWAAYTENLFWKLVILVSCGLSWDHVCTFRELFTPSRVKDASSVNKMTPNISGCACIQWHKSIRWAWSPGYRLIVPTYSLSERTATLRRQPVSRNVWWIRVNTRLDGILRSGKRLRYSSTAAGALPLQIPYTKWMSIFRVGKHIRHFCNS